MQTLTKDDLKRMNETNKEDFVLINVLPREAFNKDHIRTSINIPVEEENFTELVDKVAGNKDKKVVVYCANFNCDASTKAAKKLEKADFTNVFEYEGGTEDWHAH